MQKNDALFVKKMREAVAAIGTALMLLTAWWLRDVWLIIFGLPGVALVVLVVGPIRIAFPRWEPEVEANSSDNSTIV